MYVDCLPIKPYEYLCFFMNSLMFLYMLPTIDDYECFVLAVKYVMMPAKKTNANAVLSIYSIVQWVGTGYHSYI